MAQFLVELYVSFSDPQSVGATTRRARRAALDLTREGTPVRLLRSICVPTDETCFYLYDADSIDAVREAVRRADLVLDHVAETAPDSM